MKIGGFADVHVLDSRNHYHSVVEDDTNIFYKWRQMSSPTMLGIVGHLQHFFQEMINAQQIPKGGEMGGLRH